MSTFTLPSSQDHHFRERAFKRSFLVSIGIHLLILGVTGSVTLFHLSSRTYSPSYSVDLVTLPAAPKPEPASQAAPAKPAPAPVSRKKEPEVKKAPAPEKKVPANTPAAVPEKSTRQIMPSGGDEAARVERRKKIEELEREARSLYEKYTAEDSVQPVEKTEPAAPRSASQPVAGVTSSGGSKRPSSNIVQRAYYDRIWSQIRSSWVLPEGVTSSATLITVVGIRIAPDGQIEQFWVEKSSGNDYYDQSAIRAIRKANPLPPLPADLGDEPLEVGINFRYPE